MPHSAFSTGFGRINGAPPSPNGAAAAQDSDLAIMTKRFEQFVAFDEEKAKFMKELFARYEYLHEQYQLLVHKVDHEHEWIAAWQSDKEQYEKWIKSMQRAIVSHSKAKAGLKADNPFVVILIDGDGMIFVDELLRAGEEGGRRAAAQLFVAAQDYLENEVDDIPFGARVVCRVYANVYGLADVLVRTGVIGQAEDFGDFVRGFTRGKTLFDFIDVGAGKDRADKKIIESFKLFSQDLHCRRILFGCSHDNGYARSLEECSDNPELIDKVVLLEGVPFEKELVSLPYNTKKFPGIFRETKVNVWGQSPFMPQPPTSIDSLQGTPKHFNILSGLPTRFPPPVRSTSNPLVDSPLPTKASLNISRTPSTSTIASDSWAARAAAPPPTADLPKYKAVKRDEGISRNRAGQRVDPPCKDYDKAEVDRVKRLKMCNVHFLRNECPFVNNCTHVHSYKPTLDEIRTLRLVARMAPCQNGSGCQDIRCIYGHRCPAPPSRMHHVKGTKSCIFGEACKFPAELHDIDTNVVKTLVVR